MCYNFFMKAESKTIQRLLKTAKGQIDGLLKMIDEDRDCMDISTQLLSTISILKKVNFEILSAHMNHCVRESFEKDSVDKQSKMDEVLGILNKLLK